MLLEPPVQTLFQGVITTLKGQDLDVVTEVPERMDARARVFGDADLDHLVDADEVNPAVIVIGKFQFAGVNPSYLGLQSVIVSGAERESGYLLEGGFITGGIAATGMLGLGGLDLDLLGAENAEAGWQPMFALGQTEASLRPSAT